MNKTRVLVFTALFISSEIILTRFFTYQTQIVRIGFGFLPIALSAIMFGPVVGGITAAISDVLRMLMFPMGFPYFPGFTASAFLTGIVYGVFLHKKPKFITITAAALTISLLIDLALNTLWLTILSKEGYFVLLPTRILKTAVMFPIQILTIQAVYKALEKVLRRAASA